MVEETITYEQPLNEPIRICLRLEHLFQQLYQHLHGETVTDSRLTILALLKILNVIDRPDLKSKLTQTLTQQASTLAQLKHAPQVDHTKLQELLQSLGQLINQLHHTSGKIGENLRHNSFLNQIRLHLYNPAGPCNFNTPAYALWLRQSNEKRIIDLQNWSSELNQLNKIVDTLLLITRNGSPPQNAIAQEGFYQQALDPNLPCQLIRLTLPLAEHVYPEVSVGKHRLVIRFLSLDSNNGAKNNKNDIRFLLNCCRV